MGLAQLQERWRVIREQERGLRWELDHKYGKSYLAPLSKRRKHDAVCKRLDAAQDKIFAWLEQHSPRSWRTGVPCYWICDELTEADALTRGQLAVIPPPGYGSYPSDSVRFAAPLPEERLELALAW